MRSLSRFSCFCLCQVSWVTSDVRVSGPIPPSPPPPPQQGMNVWLLCGSGCKKKKKKIPLICPAVPFFDNEKQQTGLLPPHYPVSLLRLLFLRRVFTPEGPKAPALLRFPSWSSALLIKKRCSFLLPCLRLGPAHSAAYA